MLAIPYEYANEVAFISDEVSLFPFTASNCNVYELRWATVDRSTLFRCLLTRIDAFDQVFDFELQRVSVCVSVKRQVARKVNIPISLVYSTTYVKNCICSGSIVLIRT
jgi:hypothetical protein